MMKLGSHRDRAGRSHKGYSALWVRYYMEPKQALAEPRIAHMFQGVSAVPRKLKRHNPGTHARQTPSESAKVYGPGKGGPDLLKSSPNSSPCVAIEVLEAFRVKVVRVLSCSAVSI
jgi:hypothetical protein